MICYTLHHWKNALLIYFWKTNTQPYFRSFISNLLSKIKIFLIHLRWKLIEAMSNRHHVILIEKNASGCVKLPTCENDTKPRKLSVFGESIWINRKLLNLLTVPEKFSVTYQVLAYRSLEAEKKCHLVWKKRNKKYSAIKTQKKPTLEFLGWTAELQ